MGSKETSLQGILQGPGESEQQYQQRAQRLLALASDPVSELAKLGFEVGAEDLASDEQKRAAWEWVKEEYGAAPEGAVVVFSDHGLGLLEGGCTWLVDVEDLAYPVAWIQLRSVFRKRERAFWGMYSREELLAHEAVHWMRAAFDEPEIEEILAYRMSRSRFRRFWGPLFRSQREVWGFLGVVAGAVALGVWVQSLWLSWSVVGGVFAGLTARLCWWRRRANWRVGS